MYSSPNISLVIKSIIMRWVGHVACLGDRTGAYRVLVGRPDGKSPLGKPRRKWKNNIKINLKEMEWEGMDWIDLAQDREGWSACKGGNGHSGSIRYPLIIYVSFCAFCSCLCHMCCAYCSLLLVFLCCSVPVIGHLAVDSTR